MLYLGVDIGTTNTKAVLLDEQQQLVDCASIPSAVPGKNGELLAQSWHEHFCQLVHRFKEKGNFGQERIVCSITAQGGSFVLLNKQYKPVSSGYSWTSLASEHWVSDLKKTIEENAFYKMTGWEPAGWLMAVKLKELRQTRPELFADMRYAATVPEFIHSQLFGELVSDITNAQITGMFDFNIGDWSPEILDWVQIPKEALPRVLSSLEVFREDAVVEGQKISFVTSSHDQYAAMRACGVDQGSLMLATGTAWVINGKSAEPIYDKHYLIHPGRDLTKDGYGYIATMGALGGGFDKLIERYGLHYRDLAGIVDEFQKAGLPRQAIDIDITQGLICVNGMNPAQAVRRYMEAVAALVRYVLEKMGVHQGLKKLLMTGGAVSGGLWPQIIANICRVPVEAVTFGELTAYGAALLAKSAVMENVKTNSWPTEAKVCVYEPESENNYDEWYHHLQMESLKRSKCYE
jgi:sugar (pentulose or hexulose) kinase